MQGVAQPFRLWVGALLKTLASAGVRFAGEQKLCQSLRPPEGIHGLQHTQQGVGPQFVDAMALTMVARHQSGQVAVLIGNTQPLAQGLDDLDPALLVAMMPRPCFPGGAALAQIMDQGSEAYLTVRGEVAGLFQHHHGVNAGIDLRMIFRALGDAIETVDFRQQLRQGMALAQYLKEDRRLLFCQGPVQLCPDPLGHQRIDFASRHHALHQYAGLWRDPKSQGGETGGKTRHPQNAYRILAEGRGNVAQQALGQILTATKGVDQATVAVLCHGIDGEVAAPEVIFQTDIRGCVYLKTFVAGGHFALGTRQGIFLAGLGVQKYREILAYLAEAPGAHVLRGRAGHYPVAIVYRQSQQFVAQGAADQIDFHQRCPVSIRGGRGSGRDPGGRAGCG